MKPIHVLGAASLCVALALPARASQFTSEAAWRAAVSNSYLLDTFESYSVGTTFGGLASLGVTIPPLTGGVGANIETALNGTTYYHTGFNALMNGAAFPGAGPMTILPGATQFRAMGFWDTRPVTGTTTLALYRANNTVIDSISFGPAGNPGFIGLVSPEPVSYALISMPVGDGWIALDDLQVSTVPAPAGSLSLLGASLFVSARRRRAA